MTIYFIALCLVSLSCKKEEIRTEKKMRLIRKLEFNTKSSEIPIAIWKYQYDAYQRISKIIENDHVETIFIYDDVNNLINKRRFNPEYNQYLDSTVYKYSNGKLEEEISYSLVNQTTLPTRIEYEYNDFVLIKKTESTGYTTRYEYNDGLCIKEIISLGGRDNAFTTHQYSNNELIVSSKFAIYPNTNALIQQIFYTYDEQSNLILEESIQVASELSTNLNYIFVYEYEAL
jgi:hypothetical protein